MEIRELLKEWNWEYRLVFRPKDHLEKDQPEKLKQIQIALNYLINEKIERYLDYIKENE